MTTAEPVEIYHPVPATRTQEILEKQINATHARTDRLFGYLLPIQWLACIILALVVSPRAWTGTSSEPHIHLLAAVFLGFSIISLPTYWALKRPGEPLTRHMIAGTQMLLSALLIHVTGGRIETHFHVFGSLALLAWYRDWRVLLTASLVVAADHVLRGIYWPQSVYGVTQIQPWRWLEHTNWMVFEDICLLLAIRQSLNEMQRIARQQADLELTHSELLAKSRTLEESELRLSEKLDSTLKDLIAARDAAMESSRLKSEFLANMSHEIRTPMNVVIGMTDVLYRNASNKEQKERLSIVKDASQGLLTIIGDILDFSKIEAGKVQIEVAEVNVLSAVEGIAEILGTQARAKGIALLSYVDPKIPGVIFGDEGRLRQLLINLVGNAIKFTDIGHVVIRAQLQSRQADRVLVDITVEDSGIGLSEAEISKLFSPFVQGDGSSTRKYGGSGLGLSICKRLVQLMGGEIGVTSQKGKGSLFKITLPFELRESEPVETLSIAPLEGKRVLVADDDPVCCEILNLYLSDWGIKAHCVTAADEAIALMQAYANCNKPFDIAVLDMFMPGMDALELLRQIEQTSDTPGTNVIMVTAFDKAGQKQHALRSGFQAYLPKPIKKQDLLRALLIAGSSNRTLPELAEDGMSHINEKLEATTGMPAKSPRSECGGLILIAEDHPANQMVAQLQLAELGFSSHVVSNGLEAVEAVLAHEYQAILMDCMMPGMDGFQATQAIREHEKNTGHHVPIIALTAKAMSDDQQKCIAAGMDDYLSKPVELLNLNLILKRWVASDKVQIEPTGQKGHNLPSGTIDIERLAADIGRDGAQMVCQLLVSETKAGLLLLEKGINGRNAKMIEEQAHRMKGSLGSAFCIAASGICRTLEEKANTASEAELRKNFLELCDRFKEVEQAVNQEFPSAKKV